MLAWPYDSIVSWLQIGAMILPWMDSVKEAIILIYFEIFFGDVQTIRKVTNFLSFQN